MAILYGSASLVEAAPRLPWVYKHLAVTRYLELHGAVDRSIDLYQRWPGFFAWTAQFAQVIGRPDPVVWAGLAEPGFALLDALLVLGIARTLSSDRRWAWTAVTLFVVSTWVGQNYFAPQAFAYALHLGVCLLLLTFFRSSPRRVTVRVERIVELIVERVLRGRSAGARAGAGARIPGDPAPTLRRRRPSVLAVGLVLTAYAVIVVSHQLTPYLALLALVPLFAAGYLRPLPMAAALTVLAVGFLGLNLGYIEQHFGLFSGFDPVDNAVYTSIDRTTLLPGAVWQGRGTRFITGAMYVLALAGLVRRIRAGGVRSALLVGWLMMSPALILVGQTYGGEGRMRVFLFAVPWLALAAAWTFRPSPSAAAARWSARVGAVATVVVLAATFVLCYFATEADYRVPAFEVAASQWLDARVVRGDIVLPTSPSFPLLVGPHYDQVILATSLAGAKQYFPGPLTPADVMTVATNNADPGAPGRAVYLVCSDGAVTADALHHLYDPGELAGLERAVAADPRASEVYDSGAVRIYRLR